MSEVCVSHLRAWAPGVETECEWQEWAKGSRQIENSTASPSLESFTSSLFRRRLSQISRMTIQVVHDTVLSLQESVAPPVIAGETPPVTPGARSGRSNLFDDMPLIFVSNRGELARELLISKTLASEKEVMPAQFSLSVFNAPIALAAIALHLHGAYTAVYPQDGNFAFAFKVALAMVRCAPRYTASRHSGTAPRYTADGEGRGGRVLLAYADEMVPKEYEHLHGAQGPNGEALKPFAFACVISEAGIAEAGETAVQTANMPSTAEDFLRHIIMS